MEDLVLFWQTNFSNMWIVGGVDGLTQTKECHIVLQIVRVELWVNDDLQNLNLHRGEIGMVNH